ncbi:ABC transporter substrate-binding protein [Candidatus Atribacteria bacterium HGW-Atribacteria-1]|nr:MAG: ABC transporter substrate-binding protein [Candidatus Atribacteria bacterium HGW-Atribacteria-1]
MKIKVLLITLLIIGLILVNGVFAQEQKTTITVSVYPDLDSVIKAVLPAFNALYPDIEVKLDVAGYGDHHTKLLTQLAAGKGVPDVTAVEIGYISQFAAKGGLVDLSQSPYNAKVYGNLYVPYAWSQSNTIDGRLTALPADIAPATMFWRRDVFAERGVSIDNIKTWDDYIEVGKKFTYDADSDGKIDHWLLANAAELAMILWGGHTHFFDEQGNCLVDNDRFVKAFTIAKKIRDAGMDAQIGSWTPEWYEAFKQGTVATEINGVWMLGHFKNWIAPDTAGKWGAAQLPEGIYTHRGGTWYAIPQVSEHKEEAWKLVKFLTTNFVIQLRAFEVTGAFPAVYGVWEDPIFEEPIPFLDVQKARLIWKEAVSHIVGVPTNVNDALAYEIVNDALSQVLNEGLAIDKALTEAKRLIEQCTH